MCRQYELGDLELFLLTNFLLPHSYNGEEESGMSIMEVNSLSGFYPEDSKEFENKFKSKGVKIAEVEDAKMVTYWDQVGCVSQCDKNLQ